jgi:hypothetical protein
VGTGETRRDAAYYLVSSGLFTSQSERGSTVAAGVATRAERRSGGRRPSWAFCLSSLPKTATVQELGTIQEKNAKCSLCVGR